MIELIAFFGVLVLCEIGHKIGRIADVLERAEKRRERETEHMRWPPRARND